MSTSEEADERALALELQHDPDYLAWVAALWTPWFGKKHGGAVAPEAAYMQWRDQGGVCAVTGLVMIPPARHPRRNPYTAVLALRDSGQAPSAPGNAVFVVRFVAAMQDAVKPLGVATLAQLAVLAGMMDGR